MGAATVVMKPELIPAIQGVVETALHSDNLARAVVLCREVLGLVPMAGAARFQAFFDAGAGSGLRFFARGTPLEPMSVPGGIIPPHGVEGTLHFALRIAAADYEVWRERLVTRGIALESETSWERGGRSLYFHGPDGQLVELVTLGIWPNY